MANDFQKEISAVKEARGNILDILENRNLEEKIVVEDQEVKD